MLVLAVLVAVLALAACGSPSPSASADATPAAGAGTDCPSTPAVNTHVATISQTPSTQGAATISPTSLEMFQTTGSGSDLLGSQPVAAFTAGFSTDPTTISLAPGQTDQTMLGFGGTLTDVSAEMLVQKMSSRAYSATMKSLFSPSAGIGLDLLRVPIGGNDFSLGNYAKAAASSNNYNEDPTRGPAGDPLKCFSIAHDREFLIPVLKAALALNPKLALIATPWSAPGWMKSGGSGYDNMDGGSLKTSDMFDYAQYLVDFIKQYRAAGVPIRYLSLDNEPDQNPTDPYPDYPVMHVTWQQEVALAATVKQALQHAGLGAVGIIGFDHNWSLSAYATDLLAHDRDDFAGIAFHCYGGDQPSAAQGFFDRFSPHQGGHGDEPWYETECTPAGPYAANPDPVDASGTPETTEPSNFTGDLGAGYGNTDREDIASVRLGSGSVMLYDLVADTDDGPTINTSCVAPTCLPLITDDSGKPLYQVGYYVLGQLSRFVAPGALRIGATVTGDSSLQSVAFKDPDGALVVLVLNTAAATTPFAINWNGENLSAQIAPYSVQTYIWNPHTVRVALPGLPPINSSPVTGAHTAVEVRPATLEFGPDDETVFAGAGGPTSWALTPAFRPIDWTSWTATAATGTGVMWINDCEPDCAAGGPFTSEPITLHASRPQNGHFSTLQVTFPDGAATDTISDNHGVLSYDFPRSQPTWAGALLNPGTATANVCSGDPFLTVYLPYGVSARHACAIAVAAHAADAVGCSTPASANTYPQPVAETASYDGYALNADGDIIFTQDYTSYFFLGVQCS